MRLLHVTITALSVALFAGDAQADTLTGSYSGFVFATPALGRVFDLGNFFGLGANANLGGERISGTFTYDPAGATSQACSPGGVSECSNYFGGIATITATIDGHTVSTGTEPSGLSLGASSRPGIGTEFSVGANENAVDIGLVVRT
jgi:hypothetical protein